MRIGIPKMSGVGAPTSYRANGGAGKRAGKGAKKKPTGNFPYIIWGADLCAGKRVKKNGLQASYP
jgi:hypothetical protein